MPLPGILDCQKSPVGLFDRFFAVSCAHALCAVAHNSHTWSLRGIFRQVHAPAENFLTFFAAAGGKLCEAF